MVWRSNRRARSKVSRGIGGRPVFEPIEQLECRRLLTISSAISFAAPVTTGLVTSSLPITNIQVGDVNNDNISDVLALNENTTAQTFLGTATGALTLSNINTTGGQAFALDDFNGDNNLDLATANGILLGNGTGTFTAVKTSTGTPAFTLPVGTVQLYIGDLNGDGKEDLVAATYALATAQGQSPSMSVTTFLGKGDGTFSAGVTTPVGSSSTLLSNQVTAALADFNGDGVLDIVTPFGVMLGNKDGSFGKPIALPLGANGRPIAQNSSIFTTGDFDGDGLPDIAIVPPGANTGTTSGTTPAQVQILFSNGNGTFTPGQLISLGTNATVNALAAVDLNKDTVLDLLVGTYSTGVAPVLYAMPGNFDGSFSAPTSVKLNGAPLQITTGDFNGDGKPDVVLLEAAANVVPSTTTVFGTNAQVLLNTSKGPQSPTVTLQVPHGAQAGAPTTLTAVLTPPAGGPAPTGNVTFYDGTTALGVAQVANNKAILTTSGLVPGQQSLSAIYGGDGNYTFSTSPSVTVNLLITNAKTPLLVASIGTVTFPTQFLPRDKGSANVTITNGGGAVARGVVAVNLYLAHGNTIDSSAVLLRSVHRSVVIGSGQSLSITPAFAAPTMAGGSYNLVVELAPVSKLTADQVPTTPVVAQGQLLAETNVFGTVGTHPNIRFTGIDAAGDKATLWIVGPGTGNVSTHSGLVDVQVTGTTTASVLHIVTTGTSAFTFGTVHVAGPLAGLEGSQASVTGSFNITGSVSKFSLRAAGTSNSNGGGGVTPLAIVRNATTPPTQVGSSITIGKGANTSFILGTMENVTLQTAAPIGSLSATTWGGGQISTSWINNLSVSSMSGDVFVRGGGKIVKARLGSISGGTWAIAGGIESLMVSGNVNLAAIYAGVDAGADNTLGTSDDGYGPASIDSILIGGSDLSSLIVAGAKPISGNDLSSFTLQPGSRIGRIVVRGVASSDSRFEAASLPPVATIQNAKVTTAIDSRFSVAGT